MRTRADSASRAMFRRDLMRDFCVVSATLSVQHGRFCAGGGVSYPILGELIGRGMLKGVFWRLKDTAHQLFRQEGNDGPDYARYDTRMSGCMPGAELEAMLDWAIGYAFHECVRLKESAYQSLHYTARLARMSSNAAPDLFKSLTPLVEQAEDILRIQLERTRLSLAHAGKLLIIYLGGHEENPYLARFLLDFDDLVKTTFGDEFDDLMLALYGGEPKRKYLLAARAYFDGGRLEKALDVLNGADVRSEEADRLRHMILAAAPDERCS